MRTKALLVTAASALAGYSAMAQVVSVNVVGFINLTVPKNGYALVANQLNTSDNKLQTIMPTFVQDGLFIKWDATKVSYKTYTYDSGEGWLDLDDLSHANPDWAPGDGAFLYNADTANDYTVTLVGEVPQGTALTVNLPPGYALVSSIPPLAQNAVDAGVPTVQDELLIKWQPGSQSYKTFTYDTGEGWLDLDDLSHSIPSLAVGEGFFIFNAGTTAMQWVRSFTVAP